MVADHGGPTNLEEQDSVFDAHTFTNLDELSRSNQHLTSTQPFHGLNLTLQTDHTVLQARKTHHAFQHAIKGIGSQVRERLMVDHYHSVDKLPTALQDEARGRGYASRNLPDSNPYLFNSTQSVLAGDAARSLAGDSAARRPLDGKLASSGR